MPEFEFGGVVLGSNVSQLVDFLRPFSRCKKYYVTNRSFCIHSKKMWHATVVHHVEGRDVLVAVSFSEADGLKEEVSFLPSLTCGEVVRKLSFPGELN